MSDSEMGKATEPEAKTWEQMSKEEVIQLAESMQQDLIDANGQVANLRQLLNQKGKDSSTSDNQVGDKRQLTDPDNPPQKRQRLEKEPTVFDPNVMTLDEVVTAIRRRPELKKQLPLAQLLIVNEQLEAEYNRYQTHRDDPPPVPRGATLADAERDVTFMQSVTSLDRTREATSARLQAMRQRQMRVTRLDSNVNTPGV